MNIHSASPMLAPSAAPVVIDTPPQLPTAPSQSGATLRVASDGSGDFQTIQAAVDAANPGDTIRVAAGTYAESVSLTGTNLALIADGPVSLTGDGGPHGIYVSGSQILVQGFNVSGIMADGTNGYSGSGFVVAGQNVTLLNNVAHSNGIAGFQTLETADAVLIEGGSAYNNTSSGVALGGGTNLTIRNVELYSTGVNGGPEGSYQYYGVLGDNVADLRMVNGQLTYFEDQAPMSHILLDGLNVHDHPGYGIRISAENGALSTRPSGRIDTFDFNLVNSTITDNGSDLSSWVGGLYHLGGVLLQHIDGGEVSGNVIQDNYTWGMDIYNSSNLLISGNLITDNNRGDATPDVTIQSAGLEINAGQNVTITGNIIAGHYAGLFSSWIPDSGDDFVSEYATATHVIVNNILSGNVEVDFEVIRDDVISRVIEGNLITSMPQWLIDYVREDIDPNFPTANSLGVDPLFTNPATGDYTFQPGSPAPAILAAAPGGPITPPDPDPDPGFDIPNPLLAWLWVLSPASEDAPILRLLVLRQLLEDAANAGPDLAVASDARAVDAQIPGPDMAPGDMPQEVRQFIFGHSLMNHFSDGDILDNHSGTATPYWMAQFAAADPDNTYLIDGMFGPFNSAADLFPQWGFEGAQGVWDPDFSFASVDFTSVVITPFNFVQQHQSPQDLSQFLPFIDTVIALEPGMTVYIYEGWADMATFIASFPPTMDEFLTYANYALGEYQVWMDAHVAAYQAARPGVTFEAIPINQALIGLLVDPVLGLQGALSGVSMTDLFEDDAPHGTDTLYFLAAVAMYSHQFGEPIPSNYVIPPEVHPLVAANIGAISDFMFEAVTGTTAPPPDPDPGFEIEFPFLALLWALSEEAEDTPVLRFLVLRELFEDFAAPASDAFEFAEAPIEAEAIEIELSGLEAAFALPAPEAEAAPPAQPLVLLDQVDDDVLIF